MGSRRGAPLVVIDDDPTGSQSVHSVPVLADWSVEVIQTALATHYSLLTTHYSLLTTHFSLLTAHYSLLTTHY